MARAVGLRAPQVAHLGRDGQVLVALEVVPEAAIVLEVLGELGREDRLLDRHRHREVLRAPIV
ncbi:MAG: hypothetical protein ACRDK1_00635 [Solirubrobacterales bacterium]